MKQSIVIISLIIFLLSGKKDLNNPVLIKAVAGDSVFANDVRFIHDKLLNGKYQVNLAPYHSSKRGYCQPDKLDSEQLIKDFEGFHNIGDIDRDKKDDYVFVLHPINRCEEGQSYYFSSTEIPRIETDSYCCHPNSIFSVGDIDEDGRNELGEYYSSCSSRYKAITIWSLKSKKWKEIKSFSYVLNQQYRLFTDFKKLFKKVAKGKLAYLEIKDVSLDGRLISQWKTVTIK